MSEKHIYDVRGRQSMIFRLYSSDVEGLVHMVFYRVAIMLAFVTAASMLWSLYTTGNPLSWFSEMLLVLVGILFIPQLFESTKAIFLIMSQGVVFGRLDPSFLHSGVKKHAVYKLYKAVPYFVIVIWIICLALLWAMWSL